jgi:hypothetical protein
VRLAEATSVHAADREFADAPLPAVPPAAATLT